MTCLQRSLWSQAASTCLLVYHGLSLCMHIDLTGRAVRVDYASLHHASTVSEVDEGRISARDALFNNLLLHLRIDDCLFPSQDLFLVLPFDLLVADQPINSGSLFPFVGDYHVLL